MKELFGQRLREQRIQHGLTLEQLAEKSELSSNYIGSASWAVAAAAGSIQLSTVPMPSLPR